MPFLRKLEPNEVQDIQNRGKGQRKLTEEQYDRFLAEYDVGDWGEAILDEGENRLTVRNRFKAAARRRGVGLEFRRSSDNLLRFRVVAENGQSANGASAPVAVPVAPEAEPAPPPAKKRGGRPKKTA
jgi:hypothetical protein